MAKTRDDLVRLDDRLTPREREILATLKVTKVMFTSQIRKLFFNTAANTNAGTRAANRAMQNLSNKELVATLDRRINGQRLGTASNLWHLTESGYRLLELGNPSPTKRMRFIEPSYLTLRHKLAVTECYVQIVELTRSHPELRISQVEFEPDSWRDYHQTSRLIKLKPDLNLVTRRGEYEYRYFIEMDLSTEPTTEIIKKCNRYHAYLATGKEQDKYGVFPLVIWIVPDEKRKILLQDVIRKEYQTLYHIFLVITPEELETTLTHDPDEELLL